MIKYNIVMCYDKILVNMAAYVIPGTCVCVWCDGQEYVAIFTNIL